LHGTLEGVTIDVHVADLDAFSRLDDDESILSSDERERAQRFRFERHRQRFTRCRALLRRLLAERLTCDAAAIAFRYGPWGKPELDGIHFNVSHSENLAVIAISREHPLGIDVESIDATREVAPLAHTAFSPAECAVFDALPGAEQRLAFYRTWARKEAYMKLAGKGFSLPSDSFTVSLAADPLTFFEDFALRDLDVHAAFACAIATSREAPPPRLHTALL
jgi:4'-phosphopantetheinyl transferase